MAGLPTDRILASYPGLTAEAVELVALYAEANLFIFRTYETACR